MVVTAGSLYPSAAGTMLQAEVRRPELHGQGPKELGYCLRPSQVYQQEARWKEIYHSHPGCRCLEQQLHQLCHKACPIAFLPLTGVSGQHLHLPFNTFHLQEAHLLKSIPSMRKLS